MNVASLSAAAVGVTAPRVAVSTGAARRDARLPSAASPVKTRGSFVDPLRATPGGKEEAESREVLDAFFVGKALAEVLLEKAGEAVSEALSTVGRLEAERDEAVRQFQEDVMAKARGRSAEGEGRGRPDQVTAAAHSFDVFPAGEQVVGRPPAS